MTRDSQNQPSSRDREHHRPSSRYDPRNDRRDHDRGHPRGDMRDRRGGGGGGDRRHRGDRGRKRPGIYFNSYEEERAWVEERRRKRRERKSCFDVKPTDEQVAMEELQKAALASHGPNPNVFLRPEERPSTGASVNLQPQQTRHARRLYIGQLSAQLSEDDIHIFLRESIHTVLGGDDPNLQEDPILNVYINRERHFAFVEFRHHDVCTACLALNGINICNRGKVIIKRPNDYNSAIAPPPNNEFMKRFDVSQLGIISPVVPDSPNKLFIGGLPYHLNDENVMELLGAFGKIKAFHLVKTDASAETSKGYCFVEYVDSQHRDVAVMGLNGMDMGGGKTLTVKIASERLEGEGAEIGTAAFSKSMNVTPIVPYGGSDSGVSIAPPIMRHVDGVDIEQLVDVAMGVTNASRAATTAKASSNGILDIANAALMAASGMSNGGSQADGLSAKTRVLVLHNMVSEEDFATEEDYVGLKEEVKEECEKFGSLTSIKIPQPKDNYLASAVLKIFLEYSTIQDAAKAERELSGRQFGSAVVACTYFSEKEYSSGQLS